MDDLEKSLYDVIMMSLWLMTSLSFDVTLTYEVRIERTPKALAFYDQISQSHALVKSQEFLEFVVLTTIPIPTIQPSMH